MKGSLQPGMKSFVDLGCFKTQSGDGHSRLFSEEERVIENLPSCFPLFASTYGLR